MSHWSPAQQCGGHVALMRTRQDLANDFQAILRSVVVYMNSKKNLVAFGLKPKLKVYHSFQ